MKECQRCGRFADDGQDTCAADGAHLSLVFAGPAMLAGAYRLERRLGSGGIGSVAVAEHVGLHRKVAVKMLRPERSFDDEARARFRVEAAALGQLEHPNIVRVTDFGVDPRAGAGPYLVMELLDGVSLRENLDAVGPLEPEAAIAILRSVAAGLDFAHQRGILHRDLKPENVFLAGCGQRGTQVKVLDFGLARPDPGQAGDHGLDVGDDPDLFGADVPARPRPDTTPPTQPTGVQLPRHSTRTGDVPGTLAYMAPELFTAGEPSRSSDVYALATLAFEMMTGKRPFSGSTNDLIVAHTCQTPRPPSRCRAGLPPELDAPLLSGLAKDPHARPATGRALVQGLDEAVLALRQRRWLAEERPRRMRLAVLVSLGVLMATGALAGIGVLADLEHRVLHAWFALTPPRPPDSRLLLVSLDEATLAADPTPIVERADEAAERIAAVLDAGARAVGLDVLLPAQWGASVAFSNLVITRSDGLVLALAADPDGALVGGECVHGAISSVLGADRAAGLFGLVNVDSDGHGRVFKVRRGVRARGDRWYPSFAARLAAPGGAGGDPRHARADRPWVDYTTDVRAFPRISWAELGPTLKLTPEVFEGRVVIIGQEFLGSGDVFRNLPHPAGGSGRVSGLGLQALMTNTLLRQASLRNPSPATTTVLIAVVAFAFVATLFAATRPGRALARVWLIAAAYLASCHPLFRLAGWILPVASVMVPLLLVTVVFAVWARRLRPYPCGSVRPHATRERT